MKFKELEAAVVRIRQLYPRDCDELEVMVRTRDVSVGPRAAARVKYVNRGIDWERNRIEIFTEEDLVKKK